MRDDSRCARDCSLTAQTEGQDAPFTRVHSDSSYGDEHNSIARQNSPTLMRVSAHAPRVV